MKITQYMVIFYRVVTKRIFTTFKLFLGNWQDCFWFLIKLYNFIFKESLNFVPWNERAYIWCVWLLEIILSPWMSNKLWSCNNSIQCVVLFSVEFLPQGWRCDNGVRYDRQRIKNKFACSGRLEVPAGLLLR